jgi:hypothetical protein
MVETLQDQGTDMVEVDTDTAAVAADLDQVSH